MAHRREPDPACRLCDGTGWKEVPSQDGGWTPDNVPCSCTGSERPTSKSRRSFFSAISHIVDDCLAAGITVYAVKMPPEKRDYLLRQVAKARKRPSLPGKEHFVCGVPVVEAPGLRQPFIVVTDENP